MTERSQESTLKNRVFTGDEIMALPSTPLGRRLLYPYLEKGKLHVLLGSSDAGKSYFALDLARAISNKEDQFIGRKLIIETGKALLVMAEDSPEDIQSRLSAFAEQKRANASDLRFIVETDRLRECLDEALTKEPADLVVVDTLGFFFRGDLNSTPDVNKFLTPLGEIARLHNTAVVIVHHIGKSKDDRIRPNKHDALGSQGITATARCVLNLRKLKDGTRELSILKGNHVPDDLKMKGQVLSFDPAEGFVDKQETTDYEQVNTGYYSKDPKLVQFVLERDREGKSVREIADEAKENGFPVGKSTVHEIIKQHLKIDNENTAPPLNRELDNGGHLETAA